MFESYQSSYEESLTQIRKGLADLDASAAPDSAAVSGLHTHFRGTTLRQLYDNFLLVDFDVSPRLNIQAIAILHINIMRMMLGGSISILFWFWITI